MKKKNKTLIVTQDLNTTAATAAEFTFGVF